MQDSTPGGLGEPAPQSVRDRRLIASGVLGLLWSVLPPFAGIYILYDLGNIAQFLQRDPVHGFWAYVAVFAITAGFGVLPTISQAFLGGWVFGMQWGLIGAIMGFTGGAAIGYMVASFVTGTSVDRWIDRHPRGRAIRDALARGSRSRTFLLVALMRMPPNSPFAMTNYALGATRVPFWIAFLATPVGMLPRTAIVCFLASSAAAGGAQSILEAVDQAPWWSVLIGVASTVAAIGVIGWIASRALARMTSQATS